MIFYPVPDADTVRGFPPGCDCTEFGISGYGGVQLFWCILVISSKTSFNCLVAYRSAAFMASTFPSLLDDLQYSCHILGDIFRLDTRIDHIDIWSCLQGHKLHTSHAWNFSVSPPCRSADVGGRLGCGQHLLESNSDPTYFCYVVNPENCPAASASDQFLGAGFRYSWGAVHEAV